MQSLMEFVQVVVNDSDDLRGTRREVDGHGYVSACRFPDTALASVQWLLDLGAQAATFTRYPGEADAFSEMVQEPPDTPPEDPQSGLVRSILPPSTGRLSRRGILGRNQRVFPR